MALIKTVVSMTTWKKRIDKVGLDIYHFFTSQVVLPDIFYLCLAEAEFPNKEKDLPKDLLKVCKAFGVTILWTPGNEYCFKRWRVYPTHYNDLVLTIDDDIWFDPELIREANTHKNEKNTIYNIFEDLTYSFKFIPNDTRDFSKPVAKSLKYRWLGCSVVCPQTFPCDVFDVHNQLLRTKLCPRCDETWLKPFSLMNNTMISFLPFSYKESIINEEMQANATWQLLCDRYYGFQIRDFQLFLNLVAYPEHLAKFKEVFPEYNDSFYLSIGFDKVLNILHSKGNH